MPKKLKNAILNQATEIENIKIEDVMKDKLRFQNIKFCSFCLLTR